MLSVYGAVALRSSKNWVEFLYAKDKPDRSFFTNIYLEVTKNEIYIIYIIHCNND